MPDESIRYRCEHCSGPLNILGECLNLNCLSEIQEPHMTHDPVNHPSHYTFGGIECIDAIHASLGDEGFIAFCRGTALAYVWRAGRKNATSQDLAKAAWYMGRAEKVAAAMEAQGVLPLKLGRAKGAVEDNT